MYSFSFIINYIYYILKLECVFMKRRYIIVIFLVTFLILNAQAARVYGTIYEWSDLENPLKNVIVEVDRNSTRVQYNISSDGTYSFEVSPGSYLIKAKYYNNNILEFSGEETFQIDRPEESQNLDLIIFPPTDPESEYLGDINLTGELDNNEPGYANLILIIVVIASIISIILFFIWKKKRVPGISGEPVSLAHENTEEKNVNEKRELPDDLRELYDIILRKGGRTSQKDLRKEVKYGEAKVSLMVTDLEDRGLIRKIKKGRSNIIIAETKNN